MAMFASVNRAVRSVYREHSDGAGANEEDPSGKRGTGRPFPVTDGLVDGTAAISVIAERRSVSFIKGGFGNPFPDTDGLVAGTETVIVLAGVGKSRALDEGLLSNSMMPDAAGGDRWQTIPV